MRTQSVCTMQPKTEPSGTAMDDQTESTAGIAPRLEEFRTRGLGGEFSNAVTERGSNEGRRHNGDDFAGAAVINFEFIVVLSHELRNSLAVLRNAAGVLRMEKCPAPSVVQTRLLIERQVGQMTRLVEDLMQVARIRGGQLRLQRARIDLRTVLTHALQSVAFDMQRRDHCVTASIPEPPMWLDADATRLEQVFVNLLSNAAKYTASGGHINLSLTREGTAAVVRIRDDGIGIAAELLPRVFDLFVQADATSERADSGLGIGLALVRSLVASHGGEVSAASEGIGRGSELTVRLPLVAQPR